MAVSLLACKFKRNATVLVHAVMVNSIFPHFLGLHEPKICGPLVFCTSAKPNIPNIVTVTPSGRFNNILNKQGMACRRGARAI